MRTHDDVPFLYWESFPGGRKDTAMLGDLDPDPLFLFTEISSLLDVSNKCCEGTECKALVHLGGTAG